MLRPNRTVRPRIESLEDRAVPAVTASFNFNFLSVVGDDTANNIVVSADAAGNLTVTNNGVAVGIVTSIGTPNTASTAFIVVDGRGGNDNLSTTSALNVRDAAGLLVSSANVSLFGGLGNDTLTVGNGGFVGGVIGGPIVGNAVQDGGDGDDRINSGFGNDVMLGGNGNDTLVWLPGTLIDTFEGGAGFDNAVIVGNGNNQGDAFVLGKSTTSPGRVLFQRTNLVPFLVDIDDCEQVTMRTQSGNDTITINGLGGTDVQRVVADGGDGDDIINGAATGVQLLLRGGNGNDTLTGGRANDIIEGGTGNDVIKGGAGNDTISGDMGDDCLNGGDGTDTLLGGDGNDWLNGGGADADPDVLIGGVGGDTFYQIFGESDVFADFDASEGDVIKAA